ncbi:CRISPR-associated endonuclease Cas3-HD [Flavonifractor plautii]|uniref:CRISPR-associated endonuclease Cas3-HD n=1 Tax=Flavonifractor plautii TaxID=292800 RepID=A0A174RM16_FLAPL|nr:CRISPR-associated endonuclease Cas3-HD [Flavonifractor plautii]
MTYLAHIAGDGRKQTAAEHLNGTAERCALFAAPFGAEELGRLAGLSHDLGKYSMEFGVWGSLWPPLRRRGTMAASRTEALREIPRMPEPFWDG